MDSQGKLKSLFSKVGNAGDLRPARRDDAPITTKTVSPQKTERRVEEKPLPKMPAVEEPVTVYDEDEELPAIAAPERPKWKKKVSREETAIVVKREVDEESEMMSREDAISHNIQMEKVLSEDRVFYPTRPDPDVYREMLSHIQIFPAFDYRDNYIIQPGTQISEEIRALRTNIWSLYFKKGVRTLGLTSCRHSEGKTTLSLNLARFMGKNKDRRVLLVDCDLRRPQMKDICQLKTHYGFDDVIEERCNLWDAIVYSERDNIFLLPTTRGHSNASEMLEYPNIPGIFTDMRRAFDFILFDTPPILSTTDPSVLGRKIDGMVMLVKAGETQRESLEYGKTLLQQVKVKVFGAILTHVRNFLPKYLYRYQYYHDYYHYYAKEKGKPIK